MESFVLSQLRPILEFSKRRPAAYHFRDADNNREIDLILEARSGQIVAIEIKSAESPSKKDARHLSWLREQVGDEFYRGVVFHTGSIAYQLDERIWALPICTIWQPQGA
jgi:predicted AAA+ superfamily ATPase